MAQVAHMVVAEALVALEQVAHMVVAEALVALEQVAACRWELAESLPA